MVSQQERTERQINAFINRFGEAHYLFACHAALPISLTTDLLYDLWQRFKRDVHGQLVDVPYIVVSDLLLSGLCDEIGHELYHIPSDLRNALVQRLQEHPRLGPQRLADVADFLIHCVERDLHSPDLYRRTIAEAQYITALAYLNPAQAAENAAILLQDALKQDQGDLGRLTHLIQSLSGPLTTQTTQPLILYAEAVSYAYRGRTQDMPKALRQQLGRGSQVNVGQVRLPLPKKGNWETFLDSARTGELEPVRWPRMSRRRWLRISLWAGAGMGISYTTQRWQNRIETPNEANPIIWGTASLETVQVDEQGEIVEQRPVEIRGYEEPLSENLNLTMVEIPGGSFLMGSPEDEPRRLDSESPQHEVSVPSFYLGMCAVTQAQYEAVMGENPSRFSGANRPVELVSWNNAMEFCRRLSDRTGREYRLPSEAEWEYACRAGTTTPFAFGETLTSDLANYRGNSTYRSEPAGEYREGTTDVGSFPPNGFGLYDMHGNVWEWCADHWHENYEGAPNDGSIWSSSDESDNSFRVLRGGSWYSFPRSCRSASRNLFSPGLHLISIFGFRVVCASPRSA